LAKSRRGQSDHDAAAQASLRDKAEAERAAEEGKGGSRKGKTETPKAA
jgi:hypothetical protein